MFAIIHGHTPTQPVSFNIWPIRHQKIWEMCLVFWSSDPSRRYSMHHVVSYLKSVSSFEAAASRDRVRKVRNLVDRFYWF